MKILIVEDELSLQSSICEYLSGLGNNCNGAKSYAQALEKLDLYQLTQK